MASTLQSAEEFLRNGRTLLTTSHLNCDPVIASLDQCNFFINDEKDLVNSAEDRCAILLDIVISKGEEACDTFLKILDKRRFDVFPRPGLRNSDLHYWISCFSFQDEPQFQNANKSDSDPCTIYQDRLRIKARQILDDKWSQSMHFLKKETKRKRFKYIPLVLDTDSAVSKIKSKKVHKSRSKKLKICIPTDKNMLSPRELVTNDEKSILLVGKPGVGKTTVALEILRLWTEEKSMQVNYRYMFYFDEPLMRIFSQSPVPQTLKDLLFHNYLSPNEALDQVLENIESNSENVVLIFDGIMDVIGNTVIKRLLDKELLNDAKILTTCRPEAEDSGYLSDWSSCRVDVLGFNHESINEYFKWMLGTESDSGVCALDNPELFSLCSVPLYAFIVTACISISPHDARNKTFTITEMYVRIFRFCTKQHGDQSVEHLDKYITDNKKEIADLALASYQAMLAKTVNLADIDHEDRSVQNAFLTTIQSRNKSSTSSKEFAFLHNTMQEFWAALFLIMNPDKIPDMLNQCHNDEERKYLKYIIPFLSGLLSDKLVELIKCLVPVKQIHATRAKYFLKIVDTFLELNQEEDCEQIVDVDNILFVCRCLYEYQSPEACLLFLEKIQYELNLQEQGTLDPHQCCVVSYVVSQSKKHTVNLDLMDCEVPDSGLKLFLDSLRNLKSLRTTSKLQMWKVALETGQFSDFDSLLQLLSSEMHLIVDEKQDQKVIQRIGEVLMRKRSENVHLHLHVNVNESFVKRSLPQAIFKNLPNIATIRISPNHLKKAVESELYLQGAMYEMKTGQRCIKKLLAVLSSDQRENFKDQCDFVLKLHANTRNTNACLLLQPVFHALPPVWVVHPSNLAKSHLLDTMKVLNVKKSAELDVTCEHSDLKQFLQCVPYVTDIRFSEAFRQPEEIHKIVKVVADLFILASESGEEALRSLSAVCSYSTFPFAEEAEDVQSSFFLDLFSQLSESSSKKTVLPALQPILEVAPAVWTLDLLTLKKTHELNELLKLQSVKKNVELRSCSFNKEKLTSFLNCLPYISNISCADEFFQTVCGILSTDREWNRKQVTELLQHLGLRISLTEMMPRRLCQAIGSVLELLDKEEVFLSLLPQDISCRGASLLFSNVKRLQTLRINEIATFKFARVAKSAKSGINSLTVEKLSLVLTSSDLSERALCQVSRSLTCLLRFWTVHNLDLSEFKMKAHLFICLLSHQGPLSIIFHKDTLQQLAEFVYDVHDEDLTQMFLEKTDGDLSTCSLSWDVIYYLVQATKKQVTLDFQEGRFHLTNIQSILTVLDTVHFKRISSQFVRAALKEIYETRAGHLIAKLLKSSGDLINLSMRDLDSTDCKALCFALHYSDGVKLNLLNSNIPNNETENIVRLLHRVSDLRIDRKLLLNFLRVSKGMEKQGYSMSALLTALNYKLDFSSHSSISSGRSGQENTDPLSLSVMDCTAISSVIETSVCHTELFLYDCYADDSALECLFPTLQKVHLHLSKSLLCQFLTLISNSFMAMSLKWASSLSKALGDQLDLSDTPLNYRTCESLQLVLDYTEELTHLNLSHCRITDACLDLLAPHLNKIINLDLTGNDITDKGVQRLHSALEGNSFTKTICLCDNHITETGLMLEEARFVTLYAGTKRCNQNVGLQSRMEETCMTSSKKQDHMEQFDPELEVKNGKIFYRFQCNTGGLFMCRATGLIFGIKGGGCVEYSVAHWDMKLLCEKQYEPAGPLYDIKMSTGEMYELHLPHCEAQVDAIGNLSVLHTHEKNRPEFMTPVKMTKTHIAVHVCRLSNYGIVDNNKQDCKNKRGQVLLFLERDISDEQHRLWVFLLPSSVPLLEVKEEQRVYEFIQTSSNCILCPNVKYALIAKKATIVQPKESLFESLHAGNYHPTYEVFLDKSVNQLRIKIRRKIKRKGKIMFKTPWSRFIILKSKQELVHGNIHHNKLQKWKFDLRKIIEDLSSDHLKKLKHLMRYCENRERIPACKLEETNQDRYALVNLIVESWGFKESVKAIKEFMNDLPRRDDFVTERLTPYLTV